MKGKFLSKIEKLLKIQNGWRISFTAGRPLSVPTICLFSAIITTKLPKRSRMCLRISRRIQIHT